jgi:hypothetical protein
MKKINESFVCSGCHKTVPLAPKTCRNHCPWCFLSLHVDGSMPGDRASDCQGKMFPTLYKITNGTTKIFFVCQICNKEHRNKIAEDDTISDLDACIQSRKLVAATSS